MLQGAADMATVENAKMNSPNVEDSFARVNFASQCEAAINEQINHEYTMSYVYHAVCFQFALVIIVVTILHCQISLQECHVLL